MRIGIDLGVQSPEETGGIWQVLKGVIEVMCRRYDMHHYVVFCVPSHHTLVDSLPSNTTVVPLPREHVSACVDRAARDEEIEVLVRHYPVEDDLIFPLSKQIVLVPDIQHEEFPDFFAPESLRTRRVAFMRVLSGAGAIGTISSFSRAKLVERPETKCPDVFLMAPALPREHAQRDINDFTPDELNCVPKGDYFIYPANLWPHKNHDRILQAFDLFLRLTGRPMEFILTGNEEGWARLREAFTSLPVRHLGYVRPQLLRLLIERATALVFFSLYEGFGIPLLEAFNVGTPVLCSNTSSLPEIGGDAVLSCDPTNIEAMCLLMRSVVEDGSVRSRLVARGKARVARFSWDASAANLIAACERVAAKPLILSYDTVLATVDKLIQQLRASEEDRAARLDVIERLDAEVTRLRSTIWEQAKSLNRRMVKRLVELTRLGGGEWPSRSSRD